MMKRILLSTYCGFLSFFALSQTISVVGITSPSCYGQCNGDVSFSITGASGPFSVSITNTLGCVNPTISAFTSTNVTLNNMCSCQYSFTFYEGSSSVIGTKTVNITQPNILILNVSPDPTICYGQVCQIFAAGSGGTPPYTYTWNPSSLIGGGPHSLSPTVTTQYIASMSDANGCYTNSMVITINVRPPLLASGYSLTQCDGGGAIFIPNITSAGNGGPYSYNWSEGSTTNSIVVSATYSTSPNSYSVVINDGCTVPGAMAVFTLNVKPIPTFTPILSSISCSTCCDGSVQLAVTGGTGSCTYNLNPVGITTPTASGLCSGTYTYCAANMYGCQACSSFTLGNSIGINELSASLVFNIYPNPSIGNIKLQSSENISHLQYEIFDVLGNKISFGNVSENINVEALDGVYIFVLRNNNVILSRKKINIIH